MSCHGSLGLGGVWHHGPTHLSRKAPNKMTNGPNKDVCCDLFEFLLNAGQIELLLAMFIKRIVVGGSAEGAEV